jgi:hypothetical protein
MVALAVQPQLRYKVMKIPLFSPPLIYGMYPIATSPHPLLFKEK